MMNIPQVFLSYAADILGDTDKGLSGGRITHTMSAYSIRYNKDIPYASLPFPKSVHNKRSALLADLKVFEPDQQYMIIRELCDLSEVREKVQVIDLKAKLIARFGDNSLQIEEFSVPGLLESTRHWLSAYPDSLKLYDEAILKYKNNMFKRNLLDDLRLSLELLLRSILKNRKSLENQMEALGAYMATSKSSKEVRNMMAKLIEYYGGYHNSYVKHDDAVVEQELQLMIEMTSAFMNFLVKLDHG